MKLKNASCFGAKNWSQALSDSNGLASGSCGLTDGSAAGDWRLPNVNEHASLIKYDNPPSFLPSGHPFANIRLEPYYTSTTYGITPTSSAMVIQFSYGLILTGSKTGSFYVWPVRGGV